MAALLGLLGCAKKNDDELEALPEIMRHDAVKTKILTNHAREQQLRAEAQASGATRQFTDIMNRMLDEQREREQVVAAELSSMRKQFDERQKEASSASTHERRAIQQEFEEKLKTELAKHDVAQLKSDNMENVSRLYEALLTNQRAIVDKIEKNAEDSIRANCMCTKLVLEMQASSSMNECLRDLRSSHDATSALHNAVMSKLVLVTAEDAKLTIHPSVQVELKVMLEQLARSIDEFCRSKTSFACFLDRNAAMLKDRADHFEKSVPALADRLFDYQKVIYALLAKIGHNPALPFEQREQELFEMHFASIVKIVSGFSAQGSRMAETKLFEPERKEQQIIVRELPPSEPKRSFTPKIFRKNKSKKNKIEVV